MGCRCSRINILVKRLQKKYEYISITGYEYWESKNHPISTWSISTYMECFQVKGSKQLENVMVLLCKINNCTVYLNRETIWWSYLSSKMLFNCKYDQCCVRGWYTALSVRCHAIHTKVVQLDRNSSKSKGCEFSYVVLLFLFFLLVYG